MSFNVIFGSSAALGSPARRAAPPDRPALTVGVVQTSWLEASDAHEAVLAEGIQIAVDGGAQIVCLQELTLSPYLAVTKECADAAVAFTEAIPEGRTTRFARRMAAATGAYVHASLYERADDGGLGFNTAICVAPDGRVLARTRKNHIPRFPGYHEDRCFRPGDSGFPVIDVADAKFGFPTCWDQWFPELARVYSLQGAEILVYPTAIGSEPHIDGFDTQPLWRQMITANGLSNSTFMVVANRVGIEHGLRFYGSSFISDPYGRIVAAAPRDGNAVLICELDLAQRSDMLEFGLLDTRRPELYQQLTRVEQGGGATP